MMTIMINGKEVSTATIRQWEKRRATWSARYLKSRLGCTRETGTCQTFLDLKLDTTEENMRKALKTSLAVSSFFTAIITKLSFGKRKLCVTEFVIKGCTAESIYNGFTDMMLNNTTENRRHCLAACPDHYLLKGCDGNVQEVIEVVGSMPIPLQFFATYGDEKGLATVRDSAYPFQAAGVARLKNGLAMGGVRHQMKDIDGGCAVRLSVEFPALIPNKNIKEHQMHLACEFYNWFTVLLEK